MASCQIVSARSSASSTHGALELGLVIIESRDGKRIGRHETVAARAVARRDAVHVQRHNFAPASSLRMHKIECSGRTHFSVPVPQRMDLGHGKLRIVCSSTSATISAARRPGFSITANRLGPFCRRGSSSSSRVTPPRARTLRSPFQARRPWGLCVLHVAALLSASALNRQRQAARRRKRSRSGIGQPGLDQTVGHQLLQVIRGARLHPRGNFLGERVQSADQASVQAFRSGGQSAGSGCRQRRLRRSRSFGARQSRARQGRSRRSGRCRMRCSSAQKGHRVACSSSAPIGRRQSSQTSRCDARFGVVQIT